MHNRIILTAETGSDIPAELAEKLGVRLVPMHVTMGSETLDDGAFPPEDVCAYYDRTKKVPKTSASMPVDFERVFGQIRRDYPNCQILHLAYSAVTTCSFQNSILAAEGSPDIVSVDTKHVSVGQAVVAMEVAQYLNDHPDCTLEQAAEEALSIRDRVQMCFLPRNLDYLRAGGRVSNAAALVGNLLGLHPCIEILDGRLMAKKKYRGKLESVIPAALRDFAEKYDLIKDKLYFICSPGLEDSCRKIAEAEAERLGFADVPWMKTGCVITCHGGPGCFGIVGICNEKA